MKKIKKAKTGQSLLEMIFAISILLIVVSAVLALTTANIFGQRESEVQIIANNLAREGIEVVRNIRDSNWLEGQNWDFGLEGSGKAILDYNSRQLNFNNCVDDLLYFDENIYRHTGSKQSLFHRCLTLENICHCFDPDQCSLVGAEEIKASACSSSEQKVGLKVRSEVNWFDKNGKRKVTLEDLIYDWK